MIEELRNNIDSELRMVQEMTNFIDRLPSAPLDEQHMLLGVIESLRKRIKILNASVEGLIKPVTLAQRLPGKETAAGIDRLIFRGSNQQVALRTEDKERYLQELSLSDGLIKRLKKRNAVKEEEIEQYKKPNFYATFANKFFLRQSSKLLKSGYFNGLNVDLRKGNINILTTTYLSMMLLTTFLSVFVALAAGIFFLIFSVSPDVPFIYAYEGPIIERILVMLGLLIAIPLGVFTSYYFYPHAERTSLARKIDSELPFVVIHMGSISGSGVEPTQIFKIVGLSKEYTYTRGEIRKLLNQINVYGYDLVTALKNVALATPSQRFAELLSGLGATISSGGDLKTFFEKRADSLLLNYRLERERFTKVAETFMDIYISVVIATPMILLLLLVMISVSGVQVGLSLNQLTLLIIFTVALINVIFLWLLGVKQPTY